MVYFAEYRKSVESFEISYHSSSVRLKDSRVGNRLDKRKKIVSNLLLWGNTRDSAIWKRQNNKRNGFFCIITFRGKKTLVQKKRRKLCAHASNV